MNRVVGWHARVGDIALRLALLQILWLLHALAGGFVLGVFPATAAVASVLRRDRMAAQDWIDAGDRRGLVREFHAEWRSELIGANVLGYLLTAAWLLVVIDHRAVRAVDVVAVPVVLVWLLTVVLAAVSGLVLVLRAHFDEGPFAAIRRALVVTLARPLLALQIVAVVAVAACVYYVLPGVGVVFGISAPLAVATAAVWSAGVLPRPNVAPALVAVR